MLPTVGLAEMAVIFGITAIKFALFAGLVYVVVRLALRAEHRRSH